MDTSDGDLPTRTNPLQQTKRSRLQYKRCNLNEQISKQLKLKAGAENLLKATGDERVRSQIVVELSFVQSNIDALRNQLGQLNTAVHAYQNDSSTTFLPLIPFGLKQTNHISFGTPFKDFILEHYSVDGEEFANEVEQLTEMRRKTIQPNRDQSGVDLLHTYFSHLAVVDKRFFGGPYALGIYFTWFDALTGEPTTQRSIAFEKGSCVFNLAALHTQIAAKRERHTASGLCSAIEHLKTAAGLFIYLRDNFSHAPSTDMTFETLNTLVTLLMAQAHECQLDQIRLEISEKMTGLDDACHIAKQAAYVSCQFGMCRRGMQTERMSTAMPMAWSSLCAVKRDHYLALAYYWTAQATMNMHSQDFREHGRDLFATHLISDGYEEMPDDKNTIVTALLKQAAMLHEDAITCVRLCKDLRAQENVIRSLARCEEQTTRLLNDCRPEYYLPDPPSIKPIPDEELVPIKPRFKNYKVIDLFQKLGPLSVFSARRQWTSPRQVTLTRSGVHSNFGFSIAGDAPVYISEVDTCGLAQNAGLCRGDIIVSFNGHNTKWACHDQIVRMLSRCGPTLTAQVISATRACITPAKSPSSLSSASNSISPPTTLPLNKQSRYSMEPASSSCASRTPRFARKNATWSLKNLITMKKISKSVPNIHSTDLYCI